MPNFIIDAPASIDEIAAHDRLAEAIARVVRAGKVKIIGVLGDWGSGKSTVIGLAQKRLDAKPEQIACFTFDAWQHQSDPQRRAFLEALVRFLEKSDAYRVDPKIVEAWRTELEKLNRQREETTTETRTHINPWTASFAVSLLLLPLGIRLIGDGSLSLEDAKDVVATGMFAAGWVLVALPLLLAGAFAILGDKLKDTAVYSLLANKGPESKSETKMRDPEPSAIEFQRVFRLIVRESASHGPPLAIIVDNLDRLPPADAVTVWSTVRSIFLGDDGMRDPDETGLPTIVMPLDETAIRKIYASKDGAEAILARSFIEKTFDVVFHVPRPVLSRRHAYLAERLRGVFQQGVSAVDAHAVGSVFEKHLAGGNPPSPRSINSFVNAIAVLAMQRTDGAIPLPVIAHFVLNREEIATDVRKWAIDHQDDLRVLSANWQNDLAALHYGVGLEAAQELFIDDPLRQAVQQRELEAVKEFAALPGFERYFIRCLDQARLGQYAIPVFGAAEILANLDRTEGWAGEAWNRLRSLSQISVGDTPFQVEDERGLTHLIASCEAPQRPLYLSGLASAFQAAEKTAVVVPGPVDGIAALVKTLLVSARASEMTDFELGVPGGLDVFVVMLLQDFSVLETRQLVPADDDLNALPGYLSRRLSDPLEALIAPDVTAALCARGHDFDWTPLIALARTQLPGHDIEAVATAVRTISALFAGSESARNLIQTWAHDGLLEAAFQTVWQNTRDEALPHVSAMQLRFGGRMPVSGGGWEERLAANYDLVEVTDDLLDAFDVSVTTGWLFDRIGQFSEDTPLLREIFRRRIATDRLPITHVFDQPQLLGLLFGLNPHDDFWIQAAEDKKALARFLDDETIDDVMPLLTALVRAGDRRRMNAVFKTAFARVRPDRWHQAIATGDALYGLVGQRFGAAGRPPYLPPDAKAALIDDLPTLITTHDPAYRERWYDFAARLWGQDQDILRDGIASELLDRSGSPAQILDVLDRGGGALLSIPKFAVEANRTVSQLIMPLIADDEGRAWLYAHADAARLWIKEADAAVKTGIKEQLYGYRDAGYANAEDLRRVLRL